MKVRTIGRLITAVAGLVLIGCGSAAPTEEDRVTDAIERLHDEMAAGRIGAVCDGLGWRVRWQIGSIGHGRKPTTCDRDVRELVLSTEQAALAGGGKDLRKTRRPDVVDVAVAPGARTAVATLSLKGEPFEVSLAKRDGEWRLDDFFGAQSPPPKELR